ncbi:protein TolQ [Marinivivus vitaminiproducens]|uniref:protein TolQ n=1 Tax=Marinivivus vitaminiproducens TaxID=3035935 RepID=UPI0027AA4EB0|nr:protein TolQ [Geminicoccaceae bacterium SCSIO 64248]
MPETAVATAALSEAAANLSFLHLFAQADLVVKVVMIILLLASVWCWAVIVDKGFRLMRLRRKTRAFETMFWSGNSLESIYRDLDRRVDHPMAAMFTAAMEEWSEGRRDQIVNEELVARVRSIMSLSQDRDLQVLERSLGSLASIGAAAPFIGLFGTVWGIMNSFQSIAMTKNTTLAVVAPGIAEALLATAMGLVAAIPAVIAYNKLSGDIDSFANRLGAFAEEFSLILSRDINGRRGA